MSRRENQTTIGAWQYYTFGPTTAWHAFERMQKEYWELRDAVHAYQAALQRGDSEAAAELEESARRECADVLITLYRVATLVGCQLDRYVDAKMLVNRGRKWAVDSTGNGQHVPEAASGRNEGDFDAEPDYTAGLPGAGRFGGGK